MSEQHPPFPRIRALLIPILVGTAATACKDTSGPGRTLVFTTQPSTAIAGQAVAPPVEVMIRDGDGNPRSGTVTLELDPNPCGWALHGGLTAQVQDTTARFANLSMDKPGRGYTLRASSGEATAVSRPFDIVSDVSVPGLSLETLLCLKPNPQGDSEGLTYVPETDAFWIADDNNRSIYEVERATGEYVSEIDLGTILEAFPGAALCDDGDGDPNTTCSYIDNFELLTYDRAAAELYLVNSVDLSPPDRPAIFRLAKGDCATCFDPVSWQPLPFETRYMGVVAHDGQVLLALDDHLYDYDYETNYLATVDLNGDSLPPAYETFSDVVDLSFDGTAMWILTVDRVLHQVDWASRTELARFDLGSFGFSLPRGLSVVQDTVYILEGDVPNPIYVLRRTQP